MAAPRLVPTLQALAAAALFGVSAPLAKLLLGQVDPIFLASFLYLGSGLGVLVFRIFNGRRASGDRQEARLTRPDYGWLFGAVIAGGVLAPILLLISLQATPAATASLLLNAEGVATALIAALVFKEALSRRALAAIGLVTAGSILLSVGAEGDWGLSLGAVGILGACLLWGIDNNLTRNISAKDPLSIVLVKGLGAGSVSFITAVIRGSDLPTPPSIAGALLLGSLSYGLSIVLFIRALRGLGAARTSAVFGMAPLAGVALSFVLFRDTLTLGFAVALALMTAAMLLLLGERHVHPHGHPAITHDHRHRHDDGHHLHDHPGMIDRSLTHAHAHTHEPLEHTHPHLPDIHHRHAHDHA